MKPSPHRGMHHIALNVRDLEACKHFYVDLLGMEIVWQPDADNLYLSSGSDNLALHKLQNEHPFNKPQHLDHLGFFLDTDEAVDAWYAYLLEQKVKISATPRDHRDGTRSFYCEDPDGNVVQMIYYPLSPSHSS